MKLWCKIDATLCCLAGYKGHLKHEVPEPYVWDQSFATDYTRIDEEHDVLFANILAVSQHPDDANKLQVLKDNMDLHFQYEEQRFCAIPNFACVQHKMKHYKFWVVLEDQQVPVGCEEINWAKNWLAQHIKNTVRLILSHNTLFYFVYFAGPPVQEEDDRR